MESAIQKVFYVSEEVRDQIPEEIRIFRPEPGPTEGFSNEIKWTKEFATYKLKSVSPAKGYNKGVLEVVYEIAKP
jgi:hypothetical protein